MAGLANEEIGNASGLYNLLRNIGGSIGISVVNTMLSRHQQVHRASLVHNIYAGSNQVQQQLQGLQSVIAERGGPSGFTLADRAYGVLNGALEQQSALLSYVDDFRYLAALCFVCVPLVFILRKAVARKGAVSAAH